MALQFVNYEGTPIFVACPPIVARERKTRPAPESFHKGWRVRGIPPDALKEAREKHAKLHGQSKEFDEAGWIRNAYRKAVRAKPYSIPDAAEACAELARKAGWLQVEVVAIEKQAAKR